MNSSTCRRIRAGRSASALPTICSSVSHSTGEQRAVSGTKDSASARKAGQSVVKNADTIKRAHPHFVENLRTLGAEVEWQ